MTIWTFKFRTYSLNVQWFKNHYAIWPPIPKTIFITKLSGRNRSVRFRALSQRLFFQCLLPFLSLHIFSNSSSSRNVLILRASLEKFIQIHASSWRSRHCSVAQTSCIHPLCCRPHLDCLCVALEAWPRHSPITGIYFHHFSCRLFDINF